MKLQTQLRGFTLVEIMIVVAIISLLAAIAVPGFLRARERAQYTSFLNTVRVFSDAVEMFAADYGEYPEDSDTGDIPTNFEDYIRITDWNKGPAIGGEWDHQLNESGIISAIGCHRFTVTEEQLEEIDRMGDDGDVDTGNLRLLANDRYYSVVADNGPD